MNANGSLLSVAELSAAGFSLRPVEAVTIARELILRAHRGELAGIPTANVIRFSPDGDILVEGPVAAGVSLERAAKLVESLLPEFDAPPSRRAPGALRLVIARGLGSLDLPPYESVPGFMDALARFASDDCASIVREIVSGGTPPELTISDIRRARRSTGLTLADIAARTRIPVSLLRELEWGYFVNWPGGPYGREQLVRYARAAGLEEDVVIRAVAPALEEAVAARGSEMPVIDGTIVAAKESTSLVRFVRGMPEVLRTPQSREPAAWIVAAATATLIAVGLIPAMWHLEPASTGSSPGEVAALTTFRTITGGPLPPGFATVASASFHAPAGEQQAGIVRARAAVGATVLRVTTIEDGSARNYHARLSPDGQLLAFDSDRDGERAIYVADAQGRNVRRLTADGFAAIPSWSPDGRSLAYVRAEGGAPDVWNIWRLDLETGSSERLTSHRRGQPLGAAWFPDGRALAYGVADALVVLSLVDGERKVYSPPRAAGPVGAVAVAPDARHVVLQLGADGIWLLDLAGGSMRRLQAGVTADAFAWDPRGEQLAYLSRTTRNWAVLRPD